MEGMIDVVSVTGPEKPPRLWIVIWLECEEPWTTLKKMGLTSIVKSGTGPYETVIASVAEWVRERLVPFTSIRYVSPAGLLRVMKNVETAVPFAGSPTMN